MPHIRPVTRPLVLTVVLIGLLSLAFSLGSLYLLTALTPVAHAHNGIDHSKPPVPITQTLSLGSRGTEVTALQGYLIHNGFLDSNATGYYGPLTQAAVIRFQRMHSLSPVGYVGPRTRALVNELSGATAGTTNSAASGSDATAASGLFTQNLRSGDEGVQVAFVQVVLKVLGYYDGPLNLTYDRDTREAVEAFQKKAELKSTSGSFNDDTRQAFNDLFIGRRDLARHTANGPGPDPDKDFSETEEEEMDESDEDTDEREHSVSSRDRIDLELKTNRSSVSFGESARLTWEAENADSCVASGGWSGTLDAEGERTIIPASGTVTYTITCTNGSDTETDSVKVRLRGSESSSGGGGGGGGGSSSDRDDDEQEHDHGQTSPQTSNQTSGSTAASPSTVAAPTLTLTVDDSSISSGGSVTVSWTATDASACTAGGDWSGSQTSSGARSFTNLQADQTYSLTCVGGGGSITKSVTVDVAAAPTQVPAPTLTFTVNDGSVSSGDSVTLTWSATNASSCTASNGWTGAQSTSGTRSIANLTESKTFGLVCTGTGGSVAKTVSVDVAPVIVEADVDPDSANPEGDALVERIGLASIPSNFDVDSELIPAGWTGAIPVSAAPDVVGAFRFICNPSHLLYDDPLVYWGQPGKSHLHQFFGNTLANANSTYESLRTTGLSTCNSPLNRSAYWIPAMMNGQGKVVRPDYVSIYYKRFPADSPNCLKRGKKGCVPLPRGLRYVFGYDMAKPDVHVEGWFNCDGPGAVPGSYPDIPTAAQHCPVGAKLGAVIHAPSCWDGKNLDSADHRSHVVYATDHGSGVCPDSHPYVIPEFTLGAWYTTDETLDRSGSWEPGMATWHLSSDVMPGMTHKPGTTLHSDWFGAWDDTVMKMWTDHCINKLLNCSAGDLGNGKQLKMFSDFSWTADPRVVDPPVDPMP